MRKIFDAPNELVVSLYQVAVPKWETELKGVRLSDVAWFIETSYFIYDEETEEEAYTEPVLHSMN